MLLRKVTLLVLGWQRFPWILPRPWSRRCVWCSKRSRASRIHQPDPAHPISPYTTPTHPTLPFWNQNVDWAQYSTSEKLQIPCYLNSTAWVSTILLFLYSILFSDWPLNETVAFQLNPSPVQPKPDLPLILPITPIYSIHYTVYSIHYTVYSIQYTVYIIQYTVYSIQYTGQFHIIQICTSLFPKLGS